MGKYIHIYNLKTNVRNLIIQLALGYIGRKYGNGKRSPIRKGEKFIAQKLTKEGESVSIKEIKSLYRSIEKGILSPFSGKNIKIPRSTDKILKAIIDEAKKIVEIRVACKKFNKNRIQFRNKWLYRDILVGSQYQLLDIHITNGNLSADEKALILFNELSKIIDTLED